MKHAILLLSLLLAPAVAVAQDSAQPSLLLRLSVSPQGPVWIGQRVTVTLTAMTPVRFAAPPAFPDIAPRGRAVVLPEASTIPGTERVGAESFAALQHSYDLFPAEAGDLLLPALTLRASVGGPDGRPLEATATAPELRIPVRPAPPGVPDLTRLAVTPVLRLTTSTDRTPDGLQVGEAVTRMLRMEAEDTAAMLLPPALWGTPDGVAVYPDPPGLEDRADRGVLRAVRTERAAYVPQRPGPVELPGFSVTWLDPRTGQVRDLRADPIRFNALPARNASQEAAPQSSWSWMAAGGMALLLLAGGAFLVLRRSTDHPEHDAFAALTAACRAGDARAVMAALFRWCDVVLPAEGNIGSLAALARCPRLVAEARVLERHLYGGEAQGAWNAAALLKAARAARRHLSHRRQRSRAAALPGLNPGGAQPPPAPRVVLRHWAR